jgi:hypothetical protein
MDHPDVNRAATKIQAQYRGHRTRKDFARIKDEVRKKNQGLVFRSNLIMIE